MQPDPPCALLPWDSEHFGRRIARVTALPFGAEAAASVGEWARRERIDCLYLLLDVGDAAGIRSAEDAGFRLVDLRVVLGRTLHRGDAAPEPPPDTVRPYAPADLPALRRIARASHRDSRFYVDGHFPESLCDALYERWIERRCAEDPEAVLVARAGGEPAGYLTCQSTDAGSIDLVAVDAQARGKGLGRQLVQASLRWFADAGRERVEVVTQGRNRAALRLYGSQGFGPREFGLWYHLWPADRDPEGAP